MKNQSNILLLGVLFVGGCATIPDRFPELSSSVESISGYRIASRGTAAPGELDTVISELLTGPLTLKSAVQVALLNNPSLHATYQDLDIAVVELVRAGRPLNPQLSAGFIYSGDGDEFDVSIVQNFLSLLTIPIRRKIAEAEVASVKLAITAGVLDVIARTQAAYFEYVAVRESITMLKQVVETLEDSYEFMGRLHEAGNVTSLDLHNEQLLFEQSRLNLAAAEMARVGRKEQLNRMLGLWGKSIEWEAPARLPALQPPADLSDFEARVVTASLELASSRQAISALADSYGLSVSTSLIPEAELGILAEKEDRETDYGYQFNIAVPVFDQGQIKAGMALAKLRQAQQQYLAVAVNLRSQARELRAQLLMLQELVSHYEDVLLPLQQVTMTETQQFYNAMQIGVFQLLQAKRLQIETGRNYIDARLAYWLMRTRVDQLLMGGMPIEGETSMLAMAGFKRSRGEH